MEPPQALVEAAQAGDLDALHALDDLLDETGGLDEALQAAAARRDAGHSGARFLWGWLALDAGEPEAEVADALLPAVQDGHAMATALRAFLLCRCLLVPGVADQGPPEDLDELPSYRVDGEVLAAVRADLHRVAGAGTPVALVYEAISHSTEHELTRDPACLDRARDLLLDPSLPTDVDEGRVGALAGITGFGWMTVARGWSRLAEQEAARDYFERAVRLGRHDAVNDVGTTFDTEDEQGRQQAAGWYRRAVALADPVAHFNLGTLVWEDGKRLQDPVLLAEADQLLRVAVEDGHTGAMHNLGLLLGASEDPAAQVEGEQLLRAGADAGHQGCAFALTGVLKDDPSRVAEAETLLRRMVEDGHHGARCDLGLLLWERGTEESVAEAEQHYRRALEDDPEDVDVLLNLGVLLKHRGEADEDLCRESRDVTERAAELGQVRARYNLGNWYRDHDQPEVAAEHYRLAVTQGHVAAHCDLANVLQQLDPPQVDEAERLLRTTASEHDHALSMNALGVLLLRHRARSTHDEAREWIRRSAEAGNPFGQAAWGKVLYQRGEHGEAREWLTRAAAEGSERARVLLRHWDDGGTEQLERWG